MIRIIQYPNGVKVLQQLVKVKKTNIQNYSNAAASLQTYEDEEWQDVPVIQRESPVSNI